MLGKKARMSQMFQKKHMFIVPMDHSVTQGPIDGLTNCEDTMKKLLGTGVDAVVLHKGTMKRMLEKEELRSFSYIMHLSASIGSSEKSYEKVLVTNVEEAVKLGALGVSVQMNLCSKDMSDMLMDLGRISRASEEWGMPLLAMMYALDDMDQLAPEKLIHAARIAEDLGADMVKIPFPGEDILEKLLSSVTIPVVISGGVYTDDYPVLLDQVDTAIHLGADGAAIGRNIFQQNDIRNAALKMSDIVHKDNANLIQAER